MSWPAPVCARCRGVRPLSGRTVCPVVMGPGGGVGRVASGHLGEGTGDDPEGPGPSASAHLGWGPFGRALLGTGLESVTTKPPPSGGGSVHCRYSHFCP